MHVVVTGASAGIGEAIAREYAAHGAKLTLVARRRAALEKIVEETGAKAFVVGADLSDPERACDFLAPAEDALGPIDVLVNNAGAQIVGPAELVDPAKGEAMMRLDVFTPMRLTRAVLPKMLARRSGTIVDVASMAGITPTPGMFYYNAAKAGLANASEGLRGELRGTGVHVMTVYPGPVDTELARRGFAGYEPSLATKLAPVGDVTTLAKMVRRGVEKKKARIIYPRMYTVALWFPRLARWVTLRFAPKIARAS